MTMNLIQRLSSIDEVTYFVHVQWVVVCSDNVKPDQWSGIGSVLAAGYSITRKIVATTVVRPLAPNEAMRR